MQKVRRTKKTRKNRTKSKSKKSTAQQKAKQLLFAKILIIMGVCSMLASGAHWYLRLQALSFDQQVVDSYLQESSGDEVQSVVPAHISIPWFIDTAIEPEIIVDGDWTISEDRASYLMQSALPGENGNIIIYGHNTREIMGNIRALKGGEVVTLQTSDGVEHQYQVASTHQVSPKDLSLLLQTDEEVLTLYTCAGILDSERFVVRATRIDG